MYLLNEGTLKAAVHFMGHIIAEAGGTATFNPLRGGHARATSYCDRIYGVLFSCSDSMFVSPPCSAGVYPRRIRHP